MQFILNTLDWIKHLSLGGKCTGMADTLQELVETTEGRRPKKTWPRGRDFEQYKLMVGDRFSTTDSDGMNSCLNKIKVLGILAFN